MQKIFNSTRAEENVSWGEEALWKWKSRYFPTGKSGPQRREKPLENPKVVKRGSSVRPAEESLALQLAAMGSVPGTRYGPLSPTRIAL